MLLADATVDAACGPDGGPWLCRLVAELTDSVDAANAAEAVSPWVSVVLIVLGAFVANRLLRRLVRRSVARWEQAGELRVRGRRVRLVPEATSPTPTVRRHQRAQTIARGVSSFVTIIVWVVAAAFALAAFGISGAAVLTSAGLIGVALGFGAQNLLRDLIAGTFMIAEDQIGVGDVVDLGVASGTVEDVTLRTTRLRDVEGVVWYVPNGVIQRVGNKSQQWARAVLDIPVGQGSDLDRAQAVIADTARALAADDAWRDRILDEPEVWGVESLTLDLVTIRLAVKTAPGEQWRVARELRARVKLALDAAGIVSAPASASGAAGPPPGPPPAPG
ncbi:MAG: mechanosensitive ion channel protein MscS [Acidimicrobiia bacterium]|nr:MAG: mechanosensitive ion channel protein MscS [Acidimicrobiia bacterium]